MTEQNQNPEHVEIAPVESNALAIMTRVEIDVQITTAKHYPRSMEKFKKGALEMVTFDAETAESCIYRRPVGKENGRPVYAEGESVRLAEIVAANYGNFRVKAIVSEMTPNYVKAVGFSHDLESNYAASSEVVESTVDRYGKPYSDRMRVVVAKAALAKARRDATFFVIPKSLCKFLTTAARAVISGKERPLNDRRNAVSQWLAKLSIDSSRVFAALGAKGIDELGNEELETLTGIRTALKDGDITLDEAFPVVKFDDKKESQQADVKAKMGSEVVEIPEEKTDVKEPAKKPETAVPVKYECLNKKCEGKPHFEPVGPDKNLCPHCLGKKIKEVKPVEQPKENKQEGTETVIPWEE